MKRSIKLWQFLGFAVTSLGGTILHYLYGWTGDNSFAALFSGINESTWEHMKLLFFPMLIFSVVQYFFFKDNKSFWCVKLRGILIGLISIPIIFYTINGVFGQTPDYVNIIIFFVSAAIAYIFEYRLFKADKLTCLTPILAAIILCLIAVAFFIFTFTPPEIPLFLDPLTNTYGIVG